MRTTFLLAVFVMFFLLSCKVFADENEEVKKIVKKVFNDTYVIRGNNATIKNTLKIDGCNIKYIYVIDGSISEQQSCNLKDLDLQNINDAGGMINIGTVNGDRKVKISTLKNLYWALSLSYDQSKYSSEKVVSSLRTLISKCK